MSSGLRMRLLVWFSSREVECVILGLHHLIFKLKALHKITSASFLAQKSL